MIMIILNNSIKNTGGYRQEFPRVAGGNAQWPVCSGKHLWGPHSGLKEKCPLHRLMHLNTKSSDGGTVWGRDATLLEKECSWRQPGGLTD